MVDIRAGAGIQPFHGVSVFLSVDLTAINATAGYVIAFNSELFDTDAFHDVSTNNSRLTIPAAFDGMYVAAGGSCSLGSIAAGDWIQGEITHVSGGSTIAQAVNFQNAQDTLWRKSLALAPRQVSTGDYFEFRLVAESDMSITVFAGSTNKATTFGLMVLGQ